MDCIALKCTCVYEIGGTDNHHHQSSQSLCQSVSVTIHGCWLLKLYHQYRNGVAFEAIPSAWNEATAAERESDRKYIR